MLWNVLYELVLFMLLLDPVLVDPNAAHKVIGRFGGSVRLRCNVHGSPQPNITWNKDGQPLNLDEVLSTNQLGEVRKYKLSRLNRTLTVRGLVDKNQGFYSCRVRPLEWLPKRDI